MAEILHELIGSLSHFLQGFIHFRWCKIFSINSIIGIMIVIRIVILMAPSFLFVYLQKVLVGSLTIHINLYQAKKSNLQT